MKIALITGANRGLGFETSKQLGLKGFKVYISGRNLEKIKMAADRLKSLGIDVEAIKLDVTKTQDIRSFIDLLKTRKEHLDVLVNNAGVFLESDGPQDTTGASILKVDPVIILKTIEANTMGPLKLIQSLVPLMIEKGGGRVINISSGMGQLKNMTGFWPGYRMSKTALNTLTKILDAEVCKDKIYVNSVCPGWVRTDMGGENAERSVEEGVKTTIWLATCDDPPHGKFFRDKQEIEW